MLFYRDIVVTFKRDGFIEIRKIFFAHSYFCSAGNWFDGIGITIGKGYIANRIGSILTFILPVMNKSL